MFRFIILQFEDFNRIIMEECQTPSFLDSIPEGTETLKKLPYILTDTPWLFYPTISSVFIPFLVSFFVRGLFATKIDLAEVFRRKMRRKRG